MSYDAHKFGRTRKGRYGPYGGSYVPETLMAPVAELTQAYEAARRDPKFVAELDDLLRNFAGRPTPLQFASRLTHHLGRSAHLFEARGSSAHRRAQN